MARDPADEAIVSAFADCREAVRLLNLDPRKMRPTARSAMVLCPWHAERSPSCHLSIVGGELVAYCHGCSAGGDVFTFAAAIFGLDPQRCFRAVKVQLAALVGVAVESRAPVRLPPLPPRRPLPPPPPYPPGAEDLWNACGPVMDDTAAATWCASRGLDGYAIEDQNLVRMLPPGASLPRWAAYKGDRDRARPWTETGHRLLVPAFDDKGVMQSVRAIRIEGEKDTPKRLPPSGHRAGGLVLADSLARLVLAGEDHASRSSPLRIIVCEGEPDFLTWATRFSDADQDAPAVVGVLGGAWTAEHAARIPDGAEVLIDTHHDEAGERYGAEVWRTLAGRCTVTRSPEVQQ